MNLEKYELKFENNFTTFTFVSIGSKGAIQKIVKFQPIDSEVYNLAFGDEIPLTNEFTDLSISDNGDTEKVLATVVEAVYIFLETYTTAYVYATGSTPSRTRLYRIGITRFYEQIKQDFYLYGQTETGFEDFNLNNNYIGFLIQRKFS